ncbi:MAG: amidinotransferase, partial [Bacteroidetes bacterium]
MTKQIASSILMIRPVSFRMNTETAVNNYYQKVIDGLTPEKAQEQALNEFDTYANKLKANGIDVVVIEDTPDP